MIVPDMILLSSTSNRSTEDQDRRRQVPSSPFPQYTKNLLCLVSLWGVFTVFF